MAATTYNLIIEQGTPYLKTFRIRNEDNSLYDLTGHSARMQFRPYYESTEISIDASTSNSKIQIDSLNSLLSINLSDTDTSSLEYKSYVYDIEIVDSLNIPKRLLQGTVTVSREVTR